MMATGRAVWAILVTTKTLRRASPGTRRSLGIFPKLHAWAQRAAAPNELHGLSAVMRAQERSPGPGRAEPLRAATGVAAKPIYGDAFHTPHATLEPVPSGFG